MGADQQPFSKSFPHDNHAEMTLNISAKNLSTGATSGFLVELPPALIPVQLVPEYADDVLVEDCAAGGSGNHYTMRANHNGSIVAPPGWGYDMNTFHLLRAEPFDTRGMGIAGEPHNVNGVFLTQQDDFHRVVKISSNIDGCVNPDTKEGTDNEGQERFYYQVRRMHLKPTLVTPLAKPSL